MNKNVYQTKYWYNHFNCVNRSISKLLITEPPVIDIKTTK